MEDLVAAIKLYSDDKNWTQLVECINSSVETIVKNASKIDAAIDALDPAQHTIGFLGILLIKIDLPNYGDFELLFTQIKNFIELCSQEQLPIVIEKFIHICHFVTRCLIDKKQTGRGIKLMTTAICKARQHESQLTSIHSDLLQLCLLSKNFKPALRFMDIDVTDIHKENGQYDSRYFLLYYYYGGMIYAAVKKYDNALFFFEVAVTTPAISVSHIMLEAYKKFILVSTYLHGKIVTLPRYTSAVVPRFLKALSSAYVELANSYGSHDPDQLRSVAEKHHQVFQRDNNAGLLKQVIASLYKRNIQRLTKTFITLSLSDMATRVKLENAQEAESYLLEMIEDGEIHATIDQKDGMVKFHDSAERYDSSTVVMKIDEEIRKCMILDEKLQKMDREISVNPQYVQKVVGLQQLDDPSKGDELMS
ncbi:COP9 signalosome complex subunit 3-like [Rhopilema esculentum]|uniref:COP9 signalosome complex subunit 3-like n=1 Tax=Rhopilema esculentum TaxID=499914 RepID=UPI0031CEB4DC